MIVIDSINVQPSSCDWPRGSRRSLYAYKISCLGGPGKQLGSLNATLGSFEIAKMRKMVGRSSSTDVRRKG